MAANFVKLNESDAIHDFPGKYNSNIELLKSEITRLEGLIAAKDERIAALETRYDTYARNLKAYVDRAINKQTDDMENRISTFEDEMTRKVNEINSKLTTIENKIDNINRIINNS
jgi:predicted RNase H-like nuclease (RuvC/YqgF family)